MDARTRAEQWRADAMRAELSDATRKPVGRKKFANSALTLFCFV